MILYKFKKLFNVQKRKHTDKLIFCHLTNVIDRDYFLEPDLLDRDKYYSFAKIKNYYFERLAKEQLPFHYYVDRIGDEWEIMLGAPLNYRSQYLQDLINLGLLSPEYKDATLIVIRDNYELNIPDIRTFKTIGQKIIEPNLFLNRRNMNNSVFWFDELFDWKTFNEDKLLYNLQSKNRYRIKPMKYFDRITFNLEVLYFT